MDTDSICHRCKALAMGPCKRPEPPKATAACVDPDLQNVCLCNLGWVRQRVVQHWELAGWILHPRAFQARKTRWETKTRCSGMALSRQQESPIPRDETSLGDCCGTNGSPNEDYGMFRCQRDVLVRLKSRQKPRVAAEALSHRNRRAATS
jgi:hypothetical protein